jgi:hypothetical protein
MAMTSIQIDSKVRNELAAIAEADFGGASLGETVRQLIMEHHFSQIRQRYEELRADPEEWASYQAEAQLTDNIAGEGLPNAREEYPEYNQLARREGGASKVFAIMRMRSALLRSMRPTSNAIIRLHQELRTTLPSAKR